MDKIIREIDKVFGENNITQWGIAKARILNEIKGRLLRPVPFTEADADKRINPFLLLENAKSVIVYLVPYKHDEKATNISDYAKGIDYHTVCKEISRSVSDILRKNGYDSKSFCDSAMLDDRYLAYSAGLGIYGKNGLIINEEYGSYVFIAYIITSASLEASKQKEHSCISCNRCVDACPGKAIGSNGIDFEKCVSYLTQKKGELSGTEQEIIKKSGYIWGCDICQRVCPHNIDVKKTPLVCFSENLVHEYSDEGLTNKEFMNKYKNRAFSWRGAGVLRRNVKISGNKQ